MTHDDVKETDPLNGYEAIELTPTWETTAEVLARCLKDGPRTHEAEGARQGAQQELVRMGRLLDLAQQEIKDLRKDK